jgi:uncharacterized protein YnzC (UPF0291/DUF896 family)
MLDKDKIERLNRLAKAKKSGAITDEELSELEALRSEYLKNFRASFKQQVENTKVIDPEGTDVTPEKLKKIQKQKNIRK